MAHLVPSNSFPYSSRGKVTVILKQFPEQGSKTSHITVTSGLCLCRPGIYEYGNFPSAEQYISFSCSLPFTHPNQHAQFM